MADLKRDPVRVDLGTDPAALVPADVLRGAEPATWIEELRGKLERGELRGLPPLRASGTGSGAGGSARGPAGRVGIRGSGRRDGPECDARGE